MSQVRLWQCAAMVVATAGVVHAQDAEKHPRQDLILREAPARDTVALGSTQTPDAPAALKRATRTTTIVLSGTADAVGTVGQVRVDGAGYIYLLDSEFNEIRVFAPDGRSLVRLGGARGAPFRSPVAIAVRTAGAKAELLVADRAKRLFVYERRGDSLALARSFELPQLAHDLCATSDRVVAQGGGYNEPETVRAYGVDGKPLRSFAPLYKTDNKLLRLTLARSQLACVQDSVVVIVPETSIADVRAYSNRGAALWVTVLAKYVGVPAFTTPDGSLRVDLPQGGFHRAFSVNPLPGGQVLVQIGYVVPPATGPGADVSVTSVMLDARTGRARALGDSLPRIVATAGQSFVVVKQKPVRTLELWKFAR